ncbi:acyl-CoA desaturase [Phenylobacterium sp.]|jgi:stearoyl-CoA desaturase (delta-9 desaturase)|uniref:acyl-CoA desaturase n=1 Tax=Phenylobacterium sp. TaxID=1871053 RepID=UPI0037C66737
MTLVPSPKALTSSDTDTSGVPVTISLPPARLRLIRGVVSGVVIGPFLGTVAALALAASSGGRVSAIALIAFAIAYCVTTLAVTIGFHRYFAHRSFKTGRTLQVMFVVLGSTALQGSLLYWVSTHRRHHRFSDTADDPHSPHFARKVPASGWRGFFHGHLGWMFAADMTNVMRFAPDIVRDPLIFRVQLQYGLWAALGLLLPLAIAGLVTRDPRTAVETFLWAGPVRLLLVHHASWAVGSLSHLYGRRPFDTDDHSANNLWVALLAFGEGLQNNHHAFPRAARHGFSWREPDLSGVVIAGLAKIRLIWDLNAPTSADLASRRRAQPQPAEKDRA